MVDPYLLARLLPCQRGPFRVLLVPYFTGLDLTFWAYRAGMGPLPLGAAPLCGNLGWDPIVVELWRYPICRDLPYLLGNLGHT